MNIWIVEDDETDSQKAAQMVVEAVSGMDGLSMRTVNLFWNPTVHWDSNLRLIEVTDGEARLTELPVEGGFTKRVAPTIVVLDLYDKELKFTARDFLENLRKWELKKDVVDPAFVVIWSVHSGEKDVQDFYTEEPKRDWRLRWLETKAPVPLKRAVQGYLRLWMESQNQ